METHRLFIKENVLDAAVRIESHTDSVHND